MKRDRGECDETILTTSESTPAEIQEAIVEAARIRAKEREDLLAKGGLINKIRATYVKFDMRAGGTYATDQEAKEMKGDWHSSFRYRY